MNIILFGYRCSGKTTLGRRLADRLSKSFVDTDDLVRKQFDIDSIAVIWQEYGEQVFRRTETELTIEVCKRSDHVIALGGGSIMQPLARKAVAQAANTLRIYLYCSPVELYRRICGDRNSAQARPNLTPLGGGIEEIKSVLTERDPVYRAVADKVFDVTQLKLEQAFRDLITLCI